jgi:hypothetical protein
MSRHVFPIAAALTILAVVLSAASLWSFLWTSPSGAVRLSLIQGCAMLWWGEPGDLFSHGGGLRVGGWSGRAIIWKPEFEPANSVMVQTGPPPAPGGMPPLKQIVGLSVVVPAWLLIPVPSVIAGITFRGWRRDRRIRAGRCALCNYDVRGLKDRCPECGRPIPSSPVRRAIAAVMARLRPRPVSVLTPARSLAP